MGWEGVFAVANCQGTCPPPERSDVRFLGAPPQTKVGSAPPYNSACWSNSGPLGTGLVLNNAVGSWNWLATFWEQTLFMRLGGMQNLLPHSQHVRLKASSTLCKPVRCAFVQWIPLQDQHWLCREGPPTHREQQRGTKLL